MAAATSLRHLENLTLSLRPTSGKRKPLYLQPPPAASLLRAVMSLPALRSLTLAHLHSCAAAESVARALSNAPAALSLRRLSLVGWRMTGDQMAVIMPALTQFTALTSLTITGNFLAEVGAAAVEALMRARGADVRELVLDDNCMGADAAAAHLAAGLRHATAATRLSLSGNRFTAAGVREIAGALHKHDARVGDCGCPCHDTPKRTAADWSKGGATAPAGPQELLEFVIQQEWRSAEGIEEIARAVLGLQRIEVVDVRVDAGGDRDDSRYVDALKLVDKVRAMKPGMLFKV